MSSFDGKFRRDSTGTYGSVPGRAFKGYHVALRTCQIGNLADQLTMACECDETATCGKLDSSRMLREASEVWSEVHFLGARRG